MFCPKCGWKNPDDATNCANCFAELKAPAPQQPQQPQQPQSQQPYAQQPYGQQPYAQQPYAQPQYGAGLASAVPNYMVWSIIVTVLSVLECNILSLIFGIIAIVKSANANSRKAAGDQAGAMADANLAKVMAIIGTIVWVIGFLMWAALIPVFIRAMHEASRNMPPP